MALVDSDKQIVPNLGKGEHGAGSRGVVSAALSDQAKADIGLRLDQGHDIRDIAQALEIPERQIRSWLYHSPEAEEARTACVAAGLGEGLNKITDAPDGLELAKGREIVNYWKWIGERLVRKHYGQEAAIQVNVLTGDQAQLRIRQLEQELGIVGDGAGPAI